MITISSFPFSLIFYLNDFEQPKRTVLTHPRDGFSWLEPPTPPYFLNELELAKPLTAVSRINSTRGRLGNRLGNRISTISRTLGMYDTSKESSRQRGLIEPVLNISAVKSVILTATVTNNSALDGRFKHQWVVAARRFRRLER